MNGRTAGVAATALALLAVAGCGGTNAAITHPPAAVTYDSPNQMLTTLVTAGFDCDDSDDPQARYNMYGALSLSCSHGPEKEGIFLDLYKTASAENAAKGSGPPNGEVAYFGANWEVTAESPATLEQARKILTAASR